MRKLFFPAAVVAAACVVTVVAQQRDPARDDSRDPATGQPPTTSARRPPPGDFGPPPEMDIGSRLELFLLRPGRVVVRDTWRVGRVECKPWDENTSPGGEGVVRVNAIVAYASDHPEDRAAGLELIVQGEFPHTFMFDVEQLGDLLVAMENVRTTAEKMRDPPNDVGRRAVYNMNGLEVGMAPHRTGGYLAPVGPDEPSVGLSPDNFQELKRLLTDAQTVLKREAAAR